jgi:hypothetical protein
MSLWLTVSLCVSIFALVLVIILGEPTDYGQR